MKPSASKDLRQKISPGQKHWIGATEKYQGKDKRKPKRSNSY